MSQPCSMSSLTERAPKSLEFLCTSTVKKENMIPSPYFGHCFSTSVSFPGQLPRSCQHPPPQHQTRAATSPRGSSAKPTASLFRAILETKGLRAQPREASRCRHQHRANSSIPHTRPASPLTTVSGGRETRGDLPKQGTA